VLAAELANIQRIGRQ